MDETSEELTALWQEPGFGEVFVDYEEATVTVYWKGTPPESVMSAIGLQPNGVEVFLEEAPYSNDELVAAGRRVLKAELNQRDKDVRLAGASPNRELSGIIVEVIAGTNLAQDERETAEGLEDIAGLPVTTTVVEGAPVPASRQNDSPPWQGGGAIATATGEDYCSIGFPVVKNGTGYLVSAAHCTGRGTGGTILDGVGDPIGIVVNRDAAPYDSLLVDPSDSPATIGKVFGGPWNASPSHSRYESYVGGASRPAVGQTVCTSGAVTGEHCNLYISDTSFDYYCHNLQECHGFRAQIQGAGVAVGGGDSGGPVFLYRADGRVGARGIIYGGQPAGGVSCPASTSVPTVCYTTVVAVGIHNVLALWGAEIETGP